MFSYLIAQTKRRPIPTLAILLFVGVLSLSLCGLHFANQQAHENYEVLYRTVPVTVSVTNLTGEQTDELEAPKWVYNVFSNQYELGDYLEDIAVKMSRDIETATWGDERLSCYNLIGITSLKSDASLFQKGDGVIVWREGYDASVLAEEEMVCIVPESWMSDGREKDWNIHLTFTYTTRTQSGFETWNYDCDLTVAGYHGAEEGAIYCPFRVADHINSRLGALSTIDSISATLADNYKIDEMWEAAADWFVEPNPTGEQTPWDYSWYSYYPYAMKVDDGQLTAAAAALERSVRINDICTVGIFVLAAGASFLVGFLMIRSRKKEIILMRTMGTPAYGIFGSFALEQLACVVLGVVLGGAAFLWRPLGQLLLFGVIYALGLTLALLVFLRKNLMATMKEDE